MLKINPAERLSAKACAEHEWFKDIPEKLKKMYK